MNIDKINDRLKGGEGDLYNTPDSLALKHGVPLELIVEQIEMGIEIEMEHSNDPEIARDITYDHMSEDPEYYTHLIEMELKYQKGENMDNKITANVYARLLQAYSAANANELKNSLLLAKKAKQYTVYLDKFIDTTEKAMKAGAAGNDEEFKINLQYRKTFFEFIAQLITHLQAIK